MLECLATEMLTVLYTADKLSEYSSQNCLEYEDLTIVLRELRALCTKSSQIQNLICDSPSLLHDLVRCMNTAIADLHQEKALLAFRIGLQCFANLVVSNEYTKEVIWNSFSEQFRTWIEVPDSKVQNYLSALYHNLILNNAKFATEFISDVSLVNIFLRNASGAGLEFAHFLLEHCITLGLYRPIHEMVHNVNLRAYLITLLETVILRHNDVKYFPDIDLVTSRFKILSDKIMKTVPEPAESVDPKEISALLHLIACASSNDLYKSKLHKDKPLIINCCFLLRALHKTYLSSSTDSASHCETNADRQSKSLEQIVLNLNKSEENVETANPEFMMKGNLIRTLGNLSYREQEVQHLVRETEVLPVILECCDIDPQNPFIREWSILAIKCLCDGNKSNQHYIAKMEKFGVPDHKILTDHRTVSFNPNVI